MSARPRSMGAVDRPSPPAPPIGPDARDPRRPFATSPFSRLARTHAFGIAGDALFAIGLAGSVFFSLDFNSARWRVALYLVLTIAPFAVAAPLIGPAIDRVRGGRRWLIVATMALRAVLSFFVIRHLNSILFYPEAFLMLVLGKAYTISKSAVVPGTVRSDHELVEANSKLTVISAIAVVVAAIPGGILLKLGGAGWTLGLGMVAFIAATFMAFRLPPTTVADEPVGEAEREELRSHGIFLAASAMALVRGIVGFLSFMLAFDFKNGGAPLWHLGVVAATAQFGFFLGAIAAPRLRRFASEEQMLVGTMFVTLVAGLVCAVIGGLAGAALLSLIVGATSSAGKQAFDAIVQRDAPDANRGRSFARFETRFQLIWVTGALLPIIFPIPADLGFVIIALVAGFAGTSYAFGLWRIHHGHPPPRLGAAAAAAIANVVSSGDDDETDDADETPPESAPAGTDPTVAQGAPWADAIVVTPAGPDASTLAADATTARRWVRSPGGAPPPPPPSTGPAVEVPAWQPPPGFVTQRLADGSETQTDEPPPSAVDRAWPRVFDGGADEADAAVAAVLAEPVVDPLRGVGRPSHPPPSTRPPSTPRSVTPAVPSTPAPSPALAPVTPPPPCPPASDEALEGQQTLPLGDETFDYPEPQWRDTEDESSN